jgi:hypothetical protein
MRDAPPNKRMHATRDTTAVIERKRAGGRVMRGVMLLLLNEASMKNILITFSVMILLWGASATSLAQAAQEFKDEPCGDMAQIIETEMKSQATKRKLDDYERLGPLCHELIRYGADQDIERRVKDFIWQHWKEKRRGFVIVTFHSIEGEPSTSFMFIEPDAKGRWHVDTKIERKLFDWNIRQPRRQTNGYTAYSVKRVPGDESRLIYQLIFMDERGKRITDF